jgi:hypothetical protein
MSTELRTGESVADYCRLCKCLLTVDEESTCKYCVINMCRK